MKKASKKETKAFWQKDAKRMLKRFRNYERSLNKYFVDMQVLGEQKVKNALLGKKTGRKAVLRAAARTNDTIWKLSYELRKLGNAIAQAHGLKMKWPA